MQFEGVLKKMRTEIGEPITYYLDFSDIFLTVNQLLSKKIELHHTGFYCLNCHKTKKIFRQGMCYDCFVSSPAAGDWIMHPELSKAHLGEEDRDLEYEKSVQLQPHIVYMAVASDLKIGVTRKTQIPTRWIDQGASYALPIIEVPNRYLAGVAEVALKSHYTDKTNWRKMLMNENVRIDLSEARKKIKSELPEQLLEFYHDEEDPLTELHYPILQYSSKIKTLNLEKNPEYHGKLVGIKGQYLLFEDGTVFNVRSHEGFAVDLKIG